MTALEIMKTVAESHGFTVADLRNTARFRKLVAARREAMLALRDAGYSGAAIGIKLNRNSNTVDYHIYSNYRAQKESKRRARLSA